MSGAVRLDSLPAAGRAIVRALLEAEAAAPGDYIRAGVEAAPARRESPDAGRAGHHPGPARRRSDPKAAA